MSMTEIPKMMRLKESHPTMKKYLELSALADKLGICIEFNSYRTTMTDNDFPDREYVIEDLEHDSHCCAVSHFPYSLEVNILYDNPEYKSLNEHD